MSEIVVCPSKEEKFITPPRLRRSDFRHALALIPALEAQGISLVIIKTFKKDSYNNITVPEIRLACQLILVTNIGIRYGFTF